MPAVNHPSAMEHGDFDINIIGKHFTTVFYPHRTAGLNGLGAYGEDHTTWSGMDLIRSELLRMDLEKWYAEARTLENRKSYLVNAINELRL